MTTERARFWRLFSIIAIVLIIFLAVLYFCTPVGGFISWYFLVPLFNPGMY